MMGAAGATRCWPNLRTTIPTPEAATLVRMHVAAGLNTRQGSVASAGEITRQGAFGSAELTATRPPTSAGASYTLASGGRDSSKWTLCPGDVPTTTHTYTGTPSTNQT